MQHRHHPWLLVMVVIAMLSVPISIRILVPHSRAVTVTKSSVSAWEGNGRQPSGVPPRFDYVYEATSRGPIGSLDIVEGSYVDGIFSEITGPSEIMTSASWLAWLGFSVSSEISSSIHLGEWRVEHLLNVGDGATLAAGDELTMCDGTTTEGKAFRFVVQVVERGTKASGLPRRRVAPVGPSGAMTK